MSLWMELRGLLGHSVIEVRSHNPNHYILKYPHFRSTKATFWPTCLNRFVTGFKQGCASSRGNQTVIQADLCAVSSVIIKVVSYNFHCDFKQNCEIMKDLVFYEGMYMDGCFLYQIFTQKWCTVLLQLKLVLRVNGDNSATTAPGSSKWANFSKLYPFWVT